MTMPDPDAADGAPPAPHPLDPVVWLLRALWQFRWLILAVMLLGTAAAVVVALRLPNVYTAIGLLRVDANQGDLLGEQPDTRYVPPETVTETEARVIRSASVLAGAVDRLDLAYAANPPLDVRLDGAARGDRAATLAAFGAALNDDLSVTATGRSFIVEVAYESADAGFAARVVNAVMESYLGIEVSARRDQSAETIGLLSKRLAELRGDLNRKEQALQDYRSTSRIAEGAGTNILSEQLARLNEELIRAQGALATAAAASAERGTAADALPEVVNSPLIQQLRAQAAEQARAVSELEALYRPTHPKLIQARSALAAINDTIASETAKIVASLGTTERVEESRVAALQAEVDKLRDRLNAQREAEIELRRLEREVEASRRVYEAFLNRVNEVQGAAGLERADGRIVAEAVAPVEPSGPNRPLVVAGGGIVSAGLGAAVAILLALLDRVARTPGDVARATGSSPLVVPPVPADATGLFGRLAGRRRNAAFAEAITQLRAALLIGAGRVRIVAFTPAPGGADAAALATAFAQASAVAGDDVVLVDGDLANPTVHTILGGRNDYGLSDAAAGFGDTGPAIQTDPQANLAYVAAGTLGESPAIARSRGMDHALDELARAFGLVVISLPTALEQPDAQALATRADVVALVVQTGRSRREALAEAAALLGVAAPSARLATVFVR